MVDFYIHQLKGSEIGNFINATPTIYSLYNHYKEKIPVNFDSPHVEQMFLDWDAIRIIGKKGVRTKGLRKLFHSGMTNTQQPDWLWMHQKIRRELGIKNSCVPHTYVDTPKPFLEGNYVVLLRGCLHNSAWKRHKECGDEIYRYMIKKVPYKIIFVGSDYDVNVINKMKQWNLNHEVYLNDTRKTLALINGAKFIIGNDTGMYHAAGAMNKHIFVLWKSTNFKKNKSPGKNCFYSFSKNWVSDFDRWLNANIR
jgi:hypothetical protein